MIALAPTDYDWFKFLSAHPELQEINFWTPTPWNIRQLNPGDHFYFLLKAPIRKIGGYGQFEYYENMSARAAWKRFGVGNGVGELDDFLGRVRRYAAHRSRDYVETEDPEIGCIVLQNPQFFQPDEYVAPQEIGLSFPDTVVKHKYFDMESLFEESTSEHATEVYWVTVGKGLGRNFDVGLEAGL